MVSLLVYPFVLKMQPSPRPPEDVFRPRRCPGKVRSSRRFGVLLPLADAPEVLKRLPQRAKLGAVLAHRQALLFLAGSGG